MNYSLTCRLDQKSLSFLTNFLELLRAIESDSNFIWIHKFDYRVVREMTYFVSLIRKISRRDFSCAALFQIRVFYINIHFFKLLIYFQFFFLLAFQCIATALL